MTVLLRCYCCGEPVGRNVALVMSTLAVDRVFVAIPEHLENFDADTTKSTIVVRHDV